MGTGPVIHIEKHTLLAVNKLCLDLIRRSMGGFQFNKRTWRDKWKIVIRKPNANKRIYDYQMLLTKWGKSNTCQLRSPWPPPSTLPHPPFPIHKTSEIIALWQMTCILPHAPITNWKETPACRSDWQALFSGPGCNLVWYSADRRSTQLQKSAFL